MNGNTRNEGFSSSGGKTDNDDFQFEFIALLHALLARPCVNYLQANTLRPQGKLTTISCSAVNVAMQERAIVP